MKAPICGICMNSDMLCPACKKKLDEGKITENDIKYSRIVFEAVRNYRPLNEVTIVRAFEGKNVAVIICGRGDKSKFIGREGYVIKKITKAARIPVRVVEDTKDMKEFIQNLILPVQLQGMNIVYSSGGEVLKIIIPKDRGIPLPEASFSEIIRLVFGKNAIVLRER